MSYNSTQYNETYYKSHCGDCYERGHGWEQVFAKQAARIVKELNPKKVLDVGCAVGYLVEGLRDLGVDAYGIDISDYAISKVREDIKPYCHVQSGTSEIKGKFDLITCIEVVEHLSPDDFKATIENMCKATDTIIFSSTPFDYNEESHISVNPVSFWVEQFAYNGFYHDTSYDCSYIAVQTMLFRRGKKTNVDLIREYEDKLFNLWVENCTLRDNVNLSNARIADLDKGNVAHATEIEKYKSILQREIERNDVDEMKLINLKTENKKLEKENSLFQEEVHKYKEIETKFQYLFNVYFRLKMSCMRNKFLKIYARIKKLPIAEFGWTKERAFYTPVFDEKFYYECNSDIAEVIGEDKEKLFMHFLNCGIKEGRRASYNFDVVRYQKNNPDIAQEFGNDWEKYFLHYLQYGYFEGRSCI